MFGLRDLGAQDGYPARIELTQILFRIKLHKHRAARERGEATNGEDRPASFDLKLGVLSRILSDNYGWDYAVGERLRQGPFAANVEWDFLGKNFPTGIFDQNTDTLSRVFLRKI
jgi:hypothetical protein